MSAYEDIPIKDIIEGPKKLKILETVTGLKNWKPVKRRTIGQVFDSEEVTEEEASLVLEELTKRIPGNYKQFIKDLTGAEPVQIIKSKKKGQCVVSIHEALILNIRKTPEEKAEDAIKMLKQKYSNLTKEMLRDWVQVLIQRADPFRSNITEKELEARFNHISPNVRKAIGVLAKADGKVLDVILKRNQVFSISDPKAMKEFQNRQLNLQFEKWLTTLKQIDKTVYKEALSVFSVFSEKLTHLDSDQVKTKKIFESPFRVIDRLESVLQNNKKAIVEQPKGEAVFYELSKNLKAIKRSLPWDSTRQTAAMRFFTKKTPPGLKGIGTKSPLIYQRIFDVIISPPNPTKSRKALQGAIENLEDILLNKNRKDLQSAIYKLQLQLDEVIKESSKKLSKPDDYLTCCLRMQHLVETQLYRQLAQFEHSRHEEQGLLEPLFYISSSKIKPKTVVDKGIVLMMDPDTFSKDERKALQDQLSASVRAKGPLALLRDKTFTVLPEARLWRVQGSNLTAGALFLNRNAKDIPFTLMASSDKPDPKTGKTPYEVYKDARAHQVTIGRVFVGKKEMTQDFEKRYLKERPSATRSK